MKATPSTLEGKIIRLLDDRTVVINLGRDSGVQVGTRFTIFSQPVEIVDPESNEPLGTYRRRKGVVVVDDVSERFCVAETPKIREETVEEQQSAFALSLTGTTKRRSTRLVQDSLDVDHASVRAIPGGDVVSVGDPVEAVMRTRTA